LELILKMAKETDSEEGEENVYSEDTREGLLDDAEISVEEEGFMSGYDKAGEDKADEDSDSEEIGDKKEDKDAPEEAEEE
jgi:hypothetical protein